MRKPGTVMGLNGVLVPDVERFWPHVDVTDDDGCWLWTAARTPDGYGAAGHGKLAHRMSFALAYGEEVLQSDETLDHLCNNKLCVRPSHLQPCSNSLNAFRMNVARKKQCDKGHALDGLLKRGGLYCKTCHREREARRVARLKGVAS